MRKFIAAGIGALTLSASALTFTAGPASAAPVIPGVCAALPALIATASGGVTSATGALGVAQTAFANENVQLSGSLTDYVNAAIDWLEAVDAGSGVDLAKSILDARTAAVGQAASEWSSARVAVFNAENTLIAAQINLQALSDLNGGLCS